MPTQRMASAQGCQQRSSFGRSAPIIPPNSTDPRVCTSGWRGSANRFQHRVFQPRRPWRGSASLSFWVAWTVLRTRLSGLEKGDSARTQGEEEVTNDTNLYQPGERTWKTGEGVRGTSSGERSGRGDWEMKRG